MAGSQNGGSGTASALRLAAVAGVALLTANCAGTPHPGASASVRGGRQVDPKYGVVPSPRLYGENDPIPKGGGRAMVGKPYVVAGHTYVPRENPRGYVREGLASWYGTAFHGRQTANGEVFDRFSVAAAHPTLPLPSYARVTNLANGHSMVVRVNDRGPYHAGRLMDVSERVAEALEFHRRGTTRVRVEYLGMASVAGSDDRKLMATLRTDGSPAGRPSGANLMVADAGEEAKPFAFRQPEPEAAPVRPVVERPRVAPAPVVVAEAPRRAAPVRVAEVAPRPAPAPAPVRVAQAAPPRPGLRALPAAMRPDAAARDRGALAQAMLAAAQAAPAARAATPRHAAPLPLTSPLQLSGAPPRPPLRPGPERSLTAKLDGAEAGERKGRAPRARTADML
ncbi:rare lipoprotein A [Methylobacterium sp. 4-46]|uniref:septal ring lytic transglycosylase RlpA family protein n=1 Tax=unclassified Methylobacterium TaxID=2615210 RepID=UPI000152DB9C|nr:MULTISPECIES: septal ring lytic transglycosylase RlpA family protein [Methylobacterium]ACA20542.1 rare lipoprotein A [Methylobacterium sp. 4-46]WFT79709.1 septal ring lytic transglycosylase RlpA family protein [Methylobacterium nodulans]